MPTLFPFYKERHAKNHKKVWLFDLSADV